MELFGRVLGGRDLSLAGELFSVPDSAIVGEVSQVLRQIAEIASRPDYCQNHNDQSVVEICVTRVTSCVRETGSVEDHCAALVALLDSCLHHNLQPRHDNDDPPHAKIAADVISCIFLASAQVHNYSNRFVMEAALPVAVKFLHKGNRELSRNMARYLSLAAIHHASLLQPHVQQIMDSVISGNYPLCRVLTQLYEVSPGPLDGHAMALVSLLPHTDQQEKLALLSLFELMAKNDPSILEASVSQLLGYLCPTTANANASGCVCIGVLKVLHCVAQRKPALLVEHSATIKKASAPPHASSAHVVLVAQILTKIGKLNKDRAQEALNFVLDQLAGSERSCHSALLKEATVLCRTYPALFTDKVLQGVRTRNNNNVQQSSSNNQVNQTSGGVTIVKLGGTTPGNQNIQSSTFTVQQNSPPAVPHVGYIKRAKFGDSRSTGRLHTPSNTHRSMTKLNIAGGSVGGLHKSLTRLSSSQQINNPSSPTQPTVAINSSGSTSNTSNVTSNSNSDGKNGNKWNVNYSSNNTNKMAVSSGGVTVTTASPFKILKHANSKVHPIQDSNQIIINPGTSVISTGSVSAGPILTQPSSSQVQSITVNPISRGKSSDSIKASPPSSVSVQHSNAVHGSVSVVNTSVLQSSLTPGGGTTVNQSLGSNPTIVTASNNASGPVTVTSRRPNNTSVTIINSNPSQRISVFEPYPMRDTVQHFCEKHLDKIKLYMDKVSLRIPPPFKCIIEERRAKKLAKLLFACQARGQHCLYSRTYFTMRTRNPRTWIHLMFLALQARSSSALSSRDSSVSSLKHCWDMLKCENKTFLTLVTSAFPGSKDQDMVLNELKQSGFFDVFELTSAREGEIPVWGCFLCNHPEKAVGFLNGNTQPVIEGQLKEKKGRWRLFRRWRTRYFTLSGAHLSCKGSSGGESIDINQIRSVKVSRGARNIPKAFEIFTGDQTLILKPKDGKNAEEWVQCLSIVVAHSQARDAPAKTNSLPARGITLKNV